MTEKERITANGYAKQIRELNEAMAHTRKSKTSFIRVYKDKHDYYGAVIKMTKAVRIMLIEAMQRDIDETQALMDLL